MVKVQLDVGKSVEILSPGIREWGVVTVLVNFVELGEERIYEIDSEQLKAWLQANRTKTWRDYAKIVLLPLYDRLKLAKDVKESLI